MPVTKTSMPPNINTSIIRRELVFTASRSDGPGGQNVNKVNSKITLKFDILNSKVLDEDQKNTVIGKLASEVTKDGVLILTSQEYRSQLQNKEVVISKFEKLLSRAFEKKKKRKATKPSKSSVQERITQKKRNAEKKKWRQKP
jgi:ribosome-associated protein